MRSTDPARLQCTCGDEVNLPVDGSGGLLLPPSVDTDVYGVFGVGATMTAALSRCVLEKIDNSTLVASKGWVQRHHVVCNSLRCGARNPTSRDHTLHAGSLVYFTLDVVVDGYMQSVDIHCWSHFTPRNPTTRYSRLVRTV